MPLHLICIVGPTASGKTAAAVQVAKALGIPVLSADARQFYAELSIGTARPQAEELDGVPHHLLGHISIHTPYTVSSFEQDALALIHSWQGKYKAAVLVGGSGLYIKTLLHGMDAIPEVPEDIRRQVHTLYESRGLAGIQAELGSRDPEFLKTADVHNHARLMRALEVCMATGEPYSSYRTGQAVQRDFTYSILGIDMAREALYKRIDARVLQMLDQGLETEARSMRAYQHLNALQTIGYREWWPYLDGASTLTEVIPAIQQNTRRYAKRQMTWFRNQLEVQWYPSGNELAEAAIEQFSALASSPESSLS